MHRTHNIWIRVAVVAGLVGVIVASTTTPGTAVTLDTGAGNGGVRALALVPTTVRGFPAATAAVEAGKLWSPSATVSGGSRPVSLQRKVGSAWSTVAVKTSTSAGIVRFSVKMPASGQFSYRLVVPRKGVMASVTTKTQTVVVVVMKSVPRTISGSFSGYQTNSHLPTGKWLTWTGSASFTWVRNRTWGTPSPYAPYVGPSAEYRLTALSADWTINLNEPDPAGGGCLYHGSGHLGISDALLGYLDHIDGQSVKADLSFDPWGDKHAGIKPGEYRLSVDAATALSYDVDCSYPATDFDPAYTTHETRFISDGLLLVSHDMTKRISATGATFAGSLLQGRSDKSMPPSNPNSANYWTWNFTGSSPLRVAHIPCSVVGC